jgi:adenine C2-methylase RlmN of 23S rRNA A2503 and tRNA A37
MRSMSVIIGIHVLSGARRGFDQNTREILRQIEYDVMSAGQRKRSPAFSFGHFIKGGDLIALNPGREFRSRRRSASAWRLSSRKSMPCFVGKPRGLDVFAACRQLRRMELTQIPTERRGISDQG